MIMPCGDKQRFRVFGRMYDGYIHVGHDFDQPLNTLVHSIDDGGVITDIAFLNGFGSLNPSSKGYCIFVKYEKYFAIYGHIITGLKVGAKVNQGDVIGKIAPFYNGRDFLPHMHMGIWLSDKTPEAPYGYLPKGNLKSWVDPIMFIGGKI
jgi:murein DD-endopeptidase MepM/ murein hydrolase activator NlpD